MRIAVSGACGGGAQNKEFQSKMHPIFAGQFRKPWGIIGRIIAKDMDKRHTNIYPSIEAFSDFDSTMRVLEIGFGSGIGINYLLSKYHFSCVGIDFSGLMYRMARGNNRCHVRQKRLQLIKNDFLLHDFGDMQFDRIIFASVTYFWSDLRTPFKKMYELLNQDGRLVFYMSNRNKLETNSLTRTKVFNRHDLSHVLDVLKEVGFRQVSSNSIVDDTESSLVIVAAKKAFSK